MSTIAKINTISYTNIAKYAGVLKANIGKVSGVDVPVPTSFRYLHRCGRCLQF
jgi:hypothetical protein